MILFGTCGMLVTGQSLRIAIQSGFSLTQIGEFAFIIATLGMSLGVLDATIYPIVVAVSVITTFTTPYFIKMSEPFYGLLERHLPARLHFLIDRYQKEADHSDAAGRPWGKILKRYLLRTLLYSTVIIAILIVAARYLYPWLVQLTPAWADLVGASVTLAAMAPFLLAVAMPVTSASSLPEHTPISPAWCSPCSASSSTSDLWQKLSRSSTRRVRLWLWQPLWVCYACCISQRGYARA